MWIAYGAVATFAVSVGYLWGFGGPFPNAWVYGWLLGGSAAVAVGGGIIGNMFPGRRLKPRDRLLEFRARLLDSRLGRFLHKLAVFGVKTHALPAGAHRPTELAIGMAADQIYESLPKESRKALKDLPALVRRLEAEAALKRARVEELNAMIADVGDQALSAQSTSLKESTAGAALGDERERLRAELSLKRDQAAQRLSMSVAALENIRLDLLRLKAGVGTVDQLTADLNAARDLQHEIDLAVEANREVEAVLREDRSAPAD